MKISKQQGAGVRSDQIISRPNTSELVICGPRQRHQARIIPLAWAVGGYARALHFAHAHIAHPFPFLRRTRTYRTRRRSHLFVVDVQINSTVKCPPVVSTSYAA
jgi:hypothetical protein